MGSDFPGTLTVNILALFDWYFGRLLCSFSQWTQEMRLFLVVGVLGGFTTFSSFSLDSILLLEKDHTCPQHFILQHLCSLFRLNTGRTVAYQTGHTMNHEITHLKVEEDDDGQTYGSLAKRNFPKLPMPLFKNVKNRSRVNGNAPKPKTRLETGQDLRLPCRTKTEKLTFRSQKGDKKFLDLSIFDDGQITDPQQTIRTLQFRAAPISHAISTVCWQNLSISKVYNPLGNRPDRDHQVFWSAGDPWPQHAIWGYFFYIKNILGNCLPCTTKNKGEINGALIKGTGKRKEAMVVDNKTEKYQNHVPRDWTQPRQWRSLCCFLAAQGAWPNTHPHRRYSRMPDFGVMKIRLQRQNHWEYDLNGRLHLHAARLMFRHQKSREIMDIRAPIGARFNWIMEKIRIWLPTMTKRPVFWYNPPTTWNQSAPLNKLNRKLYPMTKWIIRILTLIVMTAIFIRRPEFYWQEQENLKTKGLKMLLVKH